MNGWNEAKEVLIVAHTPDCKFEGRIISGSIDSMPVSAFIIELKRCLWGTKHQEEYDDFLKLIAYPCQERQQARVLGLNPNSHRKVRNIKRHIEETLIEDGVNIMPKWLYDKCSEAHYINLKGSGELW